MELQSYFRPNDTSKSNNPALANSNLGLLVSTASLEDLLQKGVEQAQLDNTNEAITCFKQVVERDPCHETALLWLGYLSSTPLQALGYYSRVIRLNPRNQTAREQFRLAFNKAQEVQLVKKTMTDKIVETSGKTLPRRVATRIPWIGEVLLEAEVITRDQLEVALEKQQELAFKKKWKPLGEILIQLDFIKRYQLEDALQFQQEQNH